jgi:hypothetical protein
MLALIKPCIVTGIIPGHQEALQAFIMNYIGDGRVNRAPVNLRSELGLT